MGMVMVMGFAADEGEDVFHKGKRRGCKRRLGEEKVGDRLIRYIDLVLSL